MENSPFWWHLPGKMGIFMGYVSLPEGRSPKKRPIFSWILEGNCRSWAKINDLRPATCWQPRYAVYEKFPKRISRNGAPIYLDSIHCANKTSQCCKNHWGWGSLLTCCCHVVLSSPSHPQKDRPSDPWSTSKWHVSAGSIPLRNRCLESSTFDCILPRKLFIITLLSHFGP